jgi:hypothetical protein
MAKLIAGQMKNYWKAAGCGLVSSGLLVAGTYLAVSHFDRDGSPKPTRTATSLSPAPVRIIPLLGSPSNSAVPLALRPREPISRYPTIPVPARSPTQDASADTEQRTASIQLPQRVDLPLTKPSRSASKPVKPAEQEVARFESCMPQCETRDPLLAAREEAPQTRLAQLTPDEDDILVRDDRSLEDGSLLGDAAHVLKRTADLPIRVVKNGRDALIDVMQLVR